MNTETNQDGVVDANNEGEGTDETVSLKKEEYAKLNETIGSLKRDLKDFKKKAEETPETKPDNKLLERLDKMALSVAGITADDEVELFNKWKEQTGREADDVVGNKIFQAELADLRTAKANQLATTDIKGEHGESGVKNTPDYWIAKATKGADGQLLFSDETPKELYSKILEKLAENEPGNSEKLKFYNSK